MEMNSVADRREYDFPVLMRDDQHQTRSKNGLPFKIMEFTANPIIGMARTMRGMNSLANYEFGERIDVRYRVAVEALPRRIGRSRLYAPVARPRCGKTVARNPD
ncbi:hypothetical protein [Mycolicibacterium monacense]|uniref:hypothetical protein n=1 Tax=Mycolicibacterium monacense TaxID=85693 RepID=UPI001F3BCE6A|nr:hypothetical protein [Mycolicibacterium monacense]